MEANVEREKERERVKIGRLEKREELENLRSKRRRLEVKTGSGVRGTIARVERGRKRVARKVGTTSRGFEPLPRVKRKRYIRKTKRKGKRNIRRPKQNQFNKDRAALRSISIEI